MSVPKHGIIAVVLFSVNILFFFSAKTNSDETLFISTQKHEFLRRNKKSISSFWLKKGYILI